MNPFSTDNVSYSSEDLASKARKVNDNKKKIKTYDKEIQAFKYLQKKSENNGFFSAQGEYETTVQPTVQHNVKQDVKQMSDIYMPVDKFLEEKSLDKKSLDKKSLDKKSLDKKSLDKFSTDNSSLSSLTSISYNTNELDKIIKTKSKYSDKRSSDNPNKKCIDFDLHSVESIESLESGESLLGHIRKCKDCKHKVSELVKTHKKKKFDIFQYKEILAICLIGFLVIIILDLLMKN